MRSTFLSKGITIFQYNTVLWPFGGSTNCQKNKYTYCGEKRIKWVCRECKNYRYLSVSWQFDTAPKGLLDIMATAFPSLRFHSWEKSWNLNNTIKSTAQHASGNTRKRTSHQAVKLQSSLSSDSKCLLKASFDYRRLLLVQVERQKLNKRAILQ